MKQKGSFWNWSKRVGIIKALKCCQNWYQVVVCLSPVAIYMFEIVEKSAKRNKCQVSVTGPWSSDYNYYYYKVLLLLSLLLLLKRLLTIQTSIWLKKETIYRQSVMWHFPLVWRFSGGKTTQKVSINMGSDCSCPTLQGMNPGAIYVTSITPRMKPRLMPQKWKSSL